MISETQFRRCQNAMKAISLLKFYIRYLVVHSISSPSCQCSAPDIKFKDPHSKLTCYKVCTKPRLEIIFAT